MIEIEEVYELLGRYIKRGRTTPYVYYREEIEEIQELQRRFPEIIAAIYREAHSSQ